MVRITVRISVIIRVRVDVIRNIHCLSTRQPYACVIFLPQVLGLASTSVFAAISCRVRAVETIIRE